MLVLRILRWIARMDLEETIQSRLTHLRPKMFLGIIDEHACMMEACLDVRLEALLQKEVYVT